MIVIVIDAVIVILHVNGNATVGVIGRRWLSREAPKTASITSTVGFTFTCTATITGPITITSTITPRDSSQVVTRNVIVIVIETVIVDVHLNGNATVGVIRPGEVGR